MNETQIDRLREIYADWGRGDYSRSDYLHPEFELVYGSDFLDEGSFKGLAAASEGWRGWLQQWSSWTARDLDYKALGDQILVLIEVRGVGISTGLELATLSANVWQFRDGKPFRVTLYTHPETPLREAGIDAP